MLGFGWLRCRHTRPVLWDYASERLSEGPMEAVEKHLHGCAACRRELESLRHAQNFLSACRAEEEPTPRSDWNALRQRLLTQSSAPLSEPAAPRRHARSAPALLRPVDRENARAPWQMQLITSMAGGFAAVGIVAVGYGLMMRHQTAPALTNSVIKPDYVRSSTNADVVIAANPGVSQKQDSSSAQMIGHVISILNNARVDSTATAFASVSPTRSVPVAVSGVSKPVSHKVTGASLPRLASDTPRPMRHPNARPAVGKSAGERADTRLVRSESGGLHFRHYTPKPEDRLPSAEQTASRYPLEQVRPVGNDSDDSNLYVVGTVQPASHDDDHDY